ncbi:DUF3306 domain-containing protein [Variovorax paradoxus]|uniref:DUF3306 domain-containing protein n=1 Tax=Variovorax paradoxus (strain EPS) TaxID=595537 RepID=E6UZJ0_VARPE|nr:DUF3306 domain-containing protein [Variovorax paradoxus]ADU37798.1 hypothetical protein Varpa_3614 [Variovorax paradoxus EPS]
MSEGFLGRWSRRKQEVREAEASVEAKTAPELVSAPMPMPATETSPLPQALPPHAPPALEKEPANELEKAPPLTLVDVEGLGIESDYKPFLAKEVAPEVKNAAFRKLFSDPHFNVMDGLDTYVDDYSKPTPMPDSVLRQMASAKFLKLFDEEPERIPPETPKAMGAEDVAQSNDSGDLPSPPVADAQPASQENDDHHADLRLQPDDAARAEDTRRGTG